jgi:flagellar FliL protein
MAKKDKDATEEGEGKKKKKPIIPIVVVLLALFGAKTFLMKPATKTAEQIAAEKKKADLDVYNACAAANHKPTLSDMVDGTDSTTTTTAAKSAKGSGAPGPSMSGGGRTIQVQLIAARAESGTPAPPVIAGMGPILGLDSVTVNLADGNYLRLGLALQLAEGVDASAAKDQGVGDKALDMALSELAKHDISQLLPPTQREQIKDDLGFETCRAYDGKVLTVYFTEFVMQKS